LRNKSPRFSESVVVVPALVSGRRCQLRRFVNREHNCAFLNERRGCAIFCEAGCLRLQVRWNALSSTRWQWMRLCRRIFLYPAASALEFGIVFGEADPPKRSPLKWPAVLPSGRLVLQSLFGFQRLCDVDLRSGILSSGNRRFARCWPLLEKATG